MVHHKWTQVWTIDFVTILQNVKLVVILAWNCIILSLVGKSGLYQTAFHHFKHILNFLVFDTWYFELYCSRKNSLSHNLWLYFYYIDNALSMCCLACIKKVIIGQLPCFEILVFKLLHSSMSENEGFLCNCEVFLHYYCYIRIFHVLTYLNITLLSYNDLI